MANPTGLVLKNAMVLIGTSSGHPWSTSGSIGSASPTDVSSAIRRVRINETYDLLDDSHMGLNSHSRIAGLIDWSMEFEMLQNFASTAAVPVDKLFDAIYGNAQPIYVEVRPVNAARTSDNPARGGMVIMENFNPIDAEHGGLQVVNASFKSAGDLSRYVSSS